MKAGFISAAVLALISTTTAVSVEHKHRVHAHDNKAHTPPTLAPPVEDKGPSDQEIATARGNHLKAAIQHRKGHKGKEMAAKELDAAVRKEERAKRARIAANHAVKKAEHLKAQAAKDRKKIDQTIAQLHIQ